MFFAVRGYTVPQIKKLLGLVMLFFVAIFITRLVSRLDPSVSMGIKYN